MRILKSARLGVCLSIVSLILLRCAFGLPRPPRFATAHETFTGIVVSEPVANEKSIPLLVRSIHEEIRISAPLYSNVRYGDLVKFDKGALLILSHHRGNPLKEALYRVKESCIAHIERFIPPPYSSLLEGLILGVKQSLGKKLQDDFRTAGVIHIVVLSGYNIMIVAVWVRKLCAWMSKRLAASMSIAAVLLFALMTGAEASVMRAAIMAIICIVAEIVRRPYNVKRALGIAAFVMILANPTIIFSDTSFQLSFLATLGLLYLSPIIEARGKLTTRFPVIGEILTSTLATQIAVFPLILYKMGQISIVGVVVNVLILGIIPATMLAGFVTIVVSFVSYYLALIAAGASYVLLWYEIAVVEFFARLPFASLTVSHFPGWAAAVAYVIIGGLYFALRDVSEAPHVQLPDHPMGLSSHQ